MRSLYLVGSLRNPEIPRIGMQIRALGYEVFDDWHAASPTADDAWKEYEEIRGHTYPQALKGWAAKHIFAFDLCHLNRMDGGVLVLPAGRSGHLEFGYLMGQGKPGYILLDQNVPRWDVMYQFANGGVYETLADLLQVLERRVHE